MAKKTWVEDNLAEVSVRDIEKVNLPRAQALFSDVSRNTAHPQGRRYPITSKTRPGEVMMGSDDPSFLSSSVKFDKGVNSADPVVSRVRQKGMYAMPAGNFESADCCKDKTAGCAAACLNTTGRLGLHTATQLARTKMLFEHPAESLALLAHEAHNHFENTIRQGFLPALRLDGTSELHIDEMDAGDYIFGGQGGEYQKTRTERGPLRGLPQAVGSEYGKRHAKGALSGPTPRSRQSNVTRVASWSEGLTKDRAVEITSEGLDIATPVTNFGSSIDSLGKKPLPSHIEMQFSRGGSGLILPAVNYDEHDAVGVRRQTGAMGVLRAKSPGFGAVGAGAPGRKDSFLREHPAVPVKLSASRHVSRQQVGEQ